MNRRVTSPTKKAKKVERSPWRRLTVDAAAGVADSISGLLLEEGALGLETEDDETRAVPGRALMPTGRSTIIATFSREEGLESRVAARIERFKQFVEAAHDAVLEWTDLFAEDWNAIFMAQWKPFRLGRRIWVVPSWERKSFIAERVGPGPIPIVLHLDPGMAFGTGTHETTQLCAEAIEEHFEEGRSLARLLDVGTGTGILSIVGLKLGAVSAKGTDIDPVAVDAAIDNARENGVGARFTANADMPDAQGPVFDGVVANILAGTLVELVSPITGAVAPGGTLWLSGILAEQERAVREPYERAGLTHKKTVERNNWVRIDFVRPR